ncbi:N-6 DNA methylase [Glycomyces paridis]|uniref:Uncharacterized protein n=1 Tax=Glycomyces paridis TaxID=2126555 RepID=A0A4S8NXC1_9ACTN|nr:N-6 DNA methylase [Glycomyces paridis]THV22098.1 hypothetical protein E9998_24070 [Glycomyces paridis]
MSTPDKPAPLLPDAAWRITSGEVATLAGVKRPVVTNWARRHPDFPAPVAHESGRALFDGREVADWLLDTGRGNTDPADLRAELTLHTLDAWRTAMPPTELVGALTALICLRQQLDRPTADRTWQAVLDRAADLDTDDRFLLAELRAVPFRLGPALAALADELTDAAYNAAEAFEWVMAARRRLGAHELAADSPAPALAKVLARVADTPGLDAGAVIAVPDVRAGDLLAALADEADPDGGRAFLAADPDPVLARLTRRRMLVRGVFEFQLHIAEAEDLAVDALGDPDVIVCALPYEAAETRDPHTALERVQAITDLLADGCSGVVLGPAAALVDALSLHGQADLLRRSFLTEGLLKAVVELPEGALPYRPGYRTAIWVLARTPREQRRGKILLIDLSAQPLTAPVLDDLADDLAIWRGAGWDTDPRHEPRQGAALPASVLAGLAGAAFSPRHRSETSRYSSAVAERPARISELEVRLESLAEQARSQNEPGLRTHAALRPEGRPVRRTTVGHLLKTHRLRRLPGHRIAPEHVTGKGRYPVLGPDEVTGALPIGSRRIDREILFTAYEHAIFTEPGDIVVTANPRFGAIVDEEGLSIVAYPARVLRVRPEAPRPLRPRVLAALLQAAASEHPRTAGAVRAPRRIDDFVIPDLDPEETERYEALLARIARRTAALREQTAILEDLTRLTAAGLIDGTLAIPPDPTAPQRRT